MAAETEPDETTAAQSIMNVTPEPISTPAPEYDELQAYTADNDTTYVAMQEGKAYLSDMPWKSATNGWGPAERDMNNKESLPNDGDTITINGVQYEKGIGCHTVSNIEIELGKGYDLFETVVGVDDYTPPGSGNVKFSVYGDGELLAQTDYMTGSDDGQALSVDVGNVQVLRLSATNNGSNNHNHADWADAKLTPKTQTVDMGYFGYCGEYYDPELDMIYLRNRYYSPGIGRFITEDPARDGVNWYAYCNNNPVMFVDPSGEVAVIDDAAAVLVITAAGTYAYVSYKRLTSPEGQKMIREGAVAIYNGVVIAGNKIIGTAVKAGTFVGKTYNDIVNFAKKSKLSKKERATDIPSWAKGEKPQKGESGKDYAKRLCDKKYGKDKYDKGPGSDYNKLKKHGDRGGK